MSVLLDRGLVVGLLVGDAASAEAGHPPVAADTIEAVEGDAVPARHHEPW